MKLIIVLVIQTMHMINSHILHGVFYNNDASEIAIMNNLHSNKVKKSVAVKYKDDLWDQGIIHYEIDDTFDRSQRRIIKQGMRMWEEISCIKFVERDPNIHKDYVAITKLDCGCCYIENKQRNKGRSELSLADGCDEIQIVLHELGHVLGFYHEHQHPDRDQYVQINEHNIDRGYEPEFWQFSSAHVNTLGLPYDYRSVMHYPENAYAYYDFLETIIPKQSIDGKIPRVGNKKVLSDGDIKAINLLYNCPTCGDTIFNKAGIIESPVYINNNFPPRIQQCEWRIVAAKGEQIALGILTSNIFESFNCITDYLEIRNGYQTNSTLLGRYCGTHENVISLLADDNAVITYVRTTNLNKPNVGFRLFYTRLCGIGDAIMINEDDSYVLKSPNYPDAYESFSNCLWEFKAPENYSIQVKFDFFSVDTSPNCENDYVQIEDVSKKEPPVIGRYCGEQNPGVVNTNVNNIYVKFTGDYNRVGIGFLAEISAESIAFK